MPGSSTTTTMHAVRSDAAISGGRRTRTSIAPRRGGSRIGRPGDGAICRSRAQSYQPTSRGTSVGPFQLGWGRRSSESPTGCRPAACSYFAPPDTVRSPGLLVGKGRLDCGGNRWLPPRSSPCGNDVLVDDPTRGRGAVLPGLQRLLRDRELVVSARLDPDARQQERAVCEVHAACVTPLRPALSSTCRTSTPR